jgi:hypothetical protein
MSLEDDDDDEVVVRVCVAVELDELVEEAVELPVADVEEVAEDDKVEDEEDELELLTVCGGRARWRMKSQTKSWFVTLWPWREEELVEEEVEVPVEERRGSARIG